MNVNLFKSQHRGPSLDKQFFVKSPTIIWLAAGMFYMYEFIHRVCIGVMVPELMQDFTISHAAIGMLSASYFYAYAFIQIPAGMMIDRYGSRILLTISSLLVAVGSLSMSITDNFLLANVSRVMVGIGSAFSFLGCLQLGTTWFNKSNFALVIGSTNLLGMSGAMLGNMPVANLVDNYGWRWVMLCIAFIGFGITLIIAFVVRDNKQELSLYSKPSEEIIHNLLMVAKTKQLWLLGLFGSLLVAPIATYAELWGVSYLENIYQIPKADAAFIVSLTFVGIWVGGPLIGYCSDKFKMRKGLLGMGTLIALLSMAAIVFVHNLPYIILSVVHIFLGFGSSCMLLCFALTAQNTDAKFRATSIAFVNTIVIGIGVMMQPTIGWLLDKFNSNFHIAFTLLLVCQISAYLILRHIKEHW